jgi:hypothetical protein
MHLFGISFEKGAFIILSTKRRLTSHGIYRVFHRF